MRAAARDLQAIKNGDHRRLVTIAWLFAFDSVTTIIQVLHNEQIVVQ